MRPLTLVERDLERPSVSLCELLSGERPLVSGRSSITIERYTAEIVRSGYPGLRHLEGRPLHAQLDGYVDRIVDRELAELGTSVRNPAALRRWMTAYAAATSTTTTFEKIRGAASGGEGKAPAKSTAIPYRDALERLYVVDPVPAWSPSRSHIAELALPPKHHLADPALAARLVGATASSLLLGEASGPPIPRDGTFLGALFESLVTSSIRVYAQVASARVGHLRTHRGDHEVDLIVERDDGRVLAAEIKLGKDPDSQAVAHLRWLESRIGDDLLDAVVITTGSEAYRRTDGIAVIPAALLGP
jgi:predicted AAA+ superfamily ATPase